MSIIVKSAGITKDGKEVVSYTMKNKRGMQAEILNIGGVIRSLLVPNSEGEVVDVVLGYEDPVSYVVNPPAFGALVGRNANRIKNATVVLDGTEYSLEKNDGENNLHGGGLGYGRVFYEVDIKEEEGVDTLQFFRVSPDMEQGFPGNVTLTMTYSLTDENELVLRYEATTDKETVVNLTNHSYFNLSGHDSGDILHEELQIFADCITTTDECNVPIGGYDNIVGTPMDFTKPKEVGQHIHEEYEILKRCGGYDHNYVVGGDLKTVRKIAILTDKKAKRGMEVYTNKPGMQLYTSNFLDNIPMLTNKSGAIYGAYHAICLETQLYPNACNVSEYPTSILKPEEKYDYTTIYKFI